MLVPQTSQTVDEKFARQDWEVLYYSPDLSHFEFNLIPKVNEKSSDIRFYTILKTLQNADCSIRKNNNDILQLPYTCQTTSVTILKIYKSLTSVFLQYPLCLYSCYCCNFIQCITILQIMFSTKTMPHELTETFIHLSIKCLRDRSLVM